MHSGKLAHPFGRENEVSVQLLFKSFCNHVYLGQWELAAACINELEEQKEVIGRSISDVLWSIARDPYGKSLQSEAVPTPLHLAWLAASELKKINTHKNEAVEWLQRDVEFRLLAFDRCKGICNDVLQELYNLFCATRPGKTFTAADDVTSKSLEFLTSVLLEDPVTGHRMISLLIMPQTPELVKVKLSRLIVSCLQILLVEMKRQEEHEDKAKDLKSRFCCLLALFEPIVHSCPQTEKFVDDLVQFLHEQPLKKSLDANSIVTCLISANNVELLHLFAKAYFAYKEQGYISERDQNQASACDRLTQRDCVLIGLSQNKDRASAWRDLFVYCYKHEKHFLELFVEVALHLIQTSDIKGLSMLFLPVEFHPLKPIILLLGWDFCSDVQTAADVLSVLWSGQEVTGMSGISSSCTRLYNQVQLTQWCLDKVSTLSGVSQIPVKSNLRALFQGLELNSALYLLHKSTRLSTLLPHEVLAFLRESPACKEYSQDSPQGPVKQVQFAFVDQNISSVYNVEQEKSLNIYRSFCIMKSFMDILTFSGETPNPWAKTSSKELHRCYSESNQGSEQSISYENCLDAKDLLKEILQPSQAEAHLQSYLKTQFQNYSKLYKERVVDVIKSAESFVKELYPVNYRLEILENIFSLLFADYDVVTGCEEESTDSSEEGAVGDSSINICSLVKPDTRNSGLEKAPDFKIDNTDVTMSDPGLRSLPKSQSQGHLSTASNNSASSNSRKYGFLANSFVIRDVLLSLKKFLQELEQTAETIEHNMIHSGSSVDITIPLAINHSHLASVVECSVTLVDFDKRSVKLLDYVKNALWGLKVTAGRGFPMEFGVLPDVDSRLDYTTPAVNNFGIDELEYSKLHNQNCIHSVSPGSSPFTMTDGSMSAASTSSTSSHRRFKKRRRHERSRHVTRSEVLSPITKLLSDKYSLLNLCLEQGYYGEALEVVKRYSIESNPMAKEAKFAEQYQRALNVLRAEEWNSGQRLSTSRLINSPKTIMSSIARAAAVGISSISLSNAIDQILSLSELPNLQFTPKQQSHSAVEKLCEIFLSSSSMSAMTIFDLAIAASKSWEKSQNLMNMAMKRMSNVCKTDVTSLASFSGMDTGMKPKVPFAPTGSFGYWNFLQRIVATLDLGHNASDPFSQFYNRGSQSILTLATMPTDATDLQHYAEAVVALERELQHVSEITKQHGILPCRGGESTHLNSQDDTSVLTALKSLLATVKKTTPTGGWTEQLLHGKSSAACREYIQALISHVVTLAETVAKLSGDPAHVFLHEPFFVLRDTPNKLLGNLVCNAGVHPKKLESVCEVLNIDIQGVLLKATCPPLPIATTVATISNRNMMNIQESGRVILNDGIVTSPCKMSSEKLVRDILTKLVHAMKEHVHQENVQEIFTSDCARLLLSSGQLKHILQATRHLQFLDLNSLKTLEEKTCFYGNLLSLLVIHMWFYQVENEEGTNLPWTYDLESVCERKIEALLWYNKLAYRVGHLGVVSYLDLKYLISRKGLKLPTPLESLLHERLKSLDLCDPWATFGFNGDPRLTFAVVDGTPASPPIMILHPELVNHQLNMATDEYLSELISFNRTNNEVIISPLVAWFAADLIVPIEMNGNAPVADMIRSKLPEEHFDLVLKSILDPEFGSKYKVKVTNYLATWPALAFNSDSWKKLQKQTCHKDSRRHSIPQDYSTPRSWPVKNTLNISHRNIATSPMSNDVLEYLSSSDDILATVATIVCANKNDKMKHVLLDDYFIASLPKNTEDPEDPVKQTIEGYRNTCLTEKYPVLTRYIWLQSLPFLAGLGMCHDLQKMHLPDEALKLVPNDISSLDQDLNVCLLLGLNFDCYQKHLTMIMLDLMKTTKSDDLIGLCQYMSLDLLHRSEHDNLRLLHDYCLCCVITRQISDEESTPNYNLILRLFDYELKCRMVLGTVEYWNVDVCLQLLKACQFRDVSRKNTTLQRLVDRRLAEMKVYQKITNAARDALSRLNESDPFLISGKFPNSSQVVDDAVETGDRTNELLTILCHWQGVVLISKQSPHMILEVLSYAKDFEAAYQWAKIYGVLEQFDQVLKEFHVASLLERNVSDVVGAYQILNDLRAKDPNHCFDVCNALISRLSSSKHILTVVEFTTNQLRSDLGQRRLAELTTLGIGCKAVLYLPAPYQSDYGHLAFSPLLLLEQLLMNNKLDWAKNVLKIYRDAVKSIDPIALNFTDVDCDQLLEKYAMKALEFPIVIANQKKLSRSSSKSSLGRLGRRRSSIALQDSPSYRQIPRTGSTGLLTHTGSVGVLPISATVPCLSHIPMARSLSSGSRKMDVPFVMPRQPPGRENWVPDEAATVCMVCCIEQFSMFNRRHHCRRCGRVVCGTCSMKTTTIAGKSSRTCDQCYMQIFPIKNVPSTADLHRMRERLSEINSNGVKKSASGRSINVVIGSNSPDQNGSPDQSPEVQQSGTEIFLLSLDDEMNKSTRGDFYYDYAPSTALCLFLLDLHSSPGTCAHVLLNLCGDVSKHLQTDTFVVRNPEVDYGLVIGIMKSLMMSAKVKFVEVNNAAGVNRCTLYRDHINLLDQLVTGNCDYIPSVEQLNKPDALRRLRDQLIQEERFILAIDVSMKCGLDPSGVWVSWGKSCIKFGDFISARDKFSKCLKAPVDMTHTQNLHHSRILADILHSLETTSSTSTDESSFTMESLLADPAQKSLDELTLDDTQLQECLFYISNYGTHITFINFYRKHNMFRKALDYILEKKCSPEVFLEGLFIPCLQSGSMCQLFEHLEQVDPDLEKWSDYISVVCKHLNNTRQYNTVYQIQLFTKDYLRAAIICINQFYLLKAQDYTVLYSRLPALMAARQHMNTYQKRQQWNKQSDAEPGTKLGMTPVEVTRYSYTIDMQAEVTTFLYTHHDNYLCMIDDTSNSTTKLPTLFGSNSSKEKVAALVLLCGKNITDGYGLSFRIIQYFKLNAVITFKEVAVRFALLHKFSNINHLLHCIQGSGAFSDVEYDDIIDACVKAVATDTSLAKEIEDLITLYKDEANKIDAYIISGKLKSAYMLAVKCGNIEYIQRIHKEALESGQQGLIKICKQLIQRQEES